MGVILLSVVTQCPSDSNYLSDASRTRAEAARGPSGDANELSTVDFIDWISLSQPRGTINEFERMRRTGCSILIRSQRAANPIHRSLHATLLSTASTARIFARDPTDYAICFSHRACSLRLASNSNSVAILHPETLLWNSNLNGPTGIRIARTSEERVRYGKRVSAATMCRQTSGRYCTRAIK